MKDQDTPNFRVTAKHSGRFGFHRIFLDNTVVIKPSVTIDTTADIYIGPYTEIKDGVYIFTHRHKWNHSQGLRKDIEIIEPISLNIGRDVFIGVNSIILGVSEIGDGAVIGAGSVVTKSIPAYEIWAGNPAVKIGERIDS